MLIRVATENVVFGSSDNASLDVQQGGNFEAGEAKFFFSPEIEVFYD
jgi:hypothetical protein